MGLIIAESIFALACSIETGLSTTTAVTVNLESCVVVAWQAAEENIDGMPIQGLSGYRIFFGETSNRYTEETFVDDPDATQVELDLTPGY